jgi:AcrR family transcriptional regulator
MKASSSPKRDLILNTGKNLFWKFGFKRVTIEEICKEAGVSKMTYYKFFTNKMALVKTIMDDHMQASLVRYRRLMDSDRPYPEKVLGLVELKREQTHSMSSEFFKDYLQSGDPELMAYLETLSKNNLEIFKNDFHKAQQNGDIRKDLKVEFIMAVLNHLIDWIQHDESLIELYNEPQDLAVELTRFLFYGILDRDKHG